MSACPALLISAPASGQGKTTLTAGLARYHRRLGRRVRVFKVGPDFLDPMILARASGAPVHSLDLWMTGEAACRRLLAEAARTADLILVEGVMGLFDGTPSSADLAAAFGLPVAAVISAQSLAQTFGAIAFGLAHFRPDVRLHGVLANRVGSARHAAMVRDSLPAAIRWLGHVGAGCDFALPDRHLGLVQANEIADLEARLERAADAIGETLLAELPPPIEFVTAPGTDDTPPRHLAGRHIAIARDDAFSFIYPANLDLLESLGAQLSYFSPLADEPVPDDADALYLPGGYPELHAARLARHQRCAASIRAHARAGRRIVAECGGMLYLLDTLTGKDGVTTPMLGLLPGAATLGTRFVSLGMQRQDGVNGAMTGHTFHYSQLSTPLVPASHATHPVTGERGEAIFHHGSIIASYLHAYWPSNPAFAASLFDDDAQKARERDTTTAHGSGATRTGPAAALRHDNALNPPDALTMTSPLETSIALAKTLEPVGSPCTDVCKLDAQSGYCQGCMRTRDEIKAWKTLPDADKLRVFDVLLARLASVRASAPDTSPR